LIAAEGLLPAVDFLHRAATGAGSRVAGALALPSVFWLGASDLVLVAFAWCGVAGALAVVAGFANAVLLALLWVLYLSFVHVGQVWYGYGWEIQLLETGFLAIFLVPLVDGRPFPRLPPSAAVLWLFRWLIVRIMLGAGLIKLRGDPCWRDLTCLYFHYETQPVPSPLSWGLHFMPPWFHRLGVIWNHATELGVPWLALGPRPARHVAGVALIVFQVFLILSGNLSFLNWLTLVPCLACFDDGGLARVLPRRLVRRAAVAAAAVVAPARGQRWATAALVVVVAALSVGPIRNLLSPSQAMNTSFDRLHLVNTYGAFGSVGRVRPELVIEGTDDPVITDAAHWQAYEFPCKPGALDRRPCVVAPYHYRLDWQIWFAAMSTPDREPWMIHLVAKLLAGDRAVLGLFAHNPFPDAPPRYVRVLLYHYRFAPPGDPSGAWWTRDLVGIWFPVFERDDLRFRMMLQSHGWTPPW
jgi:hypothetical protein